MKILHIGKYYPPYHGGMEYFLRDLAVAQQRVGHQVTLFVHHHHNRTPRQQESATATTPTLIRTPQYGRLLFTPISPLFGPHLASAIQQHTPQLLHIHLPNPSAFALLALPAARALPWVIHWHADVLTPQSSPAIRHAYRLYRPFEQALLRRAQRIIATSPPYLATSPALAPHRHRCQVIPLGIDRQRVTPHPVFPLPAEPPGGPLRILAIGRLTYYKGFTHLLQALTRLPHAHLTLVGEGEQEGALRAQIDDLALHQQVTLLGSLAPFALAEQMEQCHCLCLPSIERTEAFGMVLLEAMAHARPVVVTEVVGSGMSWLVKSGENGLRCPPGDPAALAQALAYLADHPAQRSAMGERGAQQFAAHFQIERIAEQFDRLYQQLLNA